MKICILFQNDFPPEPRLARTAQALMQLGHEVELFCDSRRGRPHEEIIDGLAVTRVRTVATREKGWRRFAGLPIFWNPIWGWQFLAFARRKKFDAIHAINVTMLPLGYLAAKLFRARGVYDMYENYPAALRSWKLRGWFNRLFRNAAVAERVDRFFISRVDHVFVVVEESATRARALGAREERLSVVYNTTDVQALLAQPLDLAIVQKYHAHFMLVYTGNVSAERGLETVIAAMPLLREKIPNAKLVIAGGGPSEQSLRALIAARALESCVEITGWIDDKLFPSYIHAAKICLVPHPANPFIDSTLPNKLFDYMALGKPVIVSDAKPLARIVQECACGAVFESHSAESFVAAVESIRLNLEEAGERGKQAVAAKYNWQNSSRALQAYYGSQSSDKPEHKKHNHGLHG